MAKLEFIRKMMNSYMRERETHENGGSEKEVIRK